MAQMIAPNEIKAVLGMVVLRTMLDPYGQAFPADALHMGSMRQLHLSQEQLKLLAGAHRDAQSCVVVLHQQFARLVCAGAVAAQL